MESKENGGWSVQLTGHPFDLEELPDWLDGSEFRVRSDGDGYYLASSRFVVIDDPEEVRRAAVEIVDQINALGRLIWEEFHPVSVGAVERLATDGSRRVALAFGSTAHMRGKFSAEVIGRDGVRRPDPNAGRLGRLISIARQSDSVQHALTFLGHHELTWNDLYRAVEVIEADVGGAMYEDAWVSKSVIRRFKHTANSYSVLGLDARHGRDRADPPAKPMVFGEARRLVLTLIRRWVESRFAGGDDLAS